MRAAGHTSPRSMPPISSLTGSDSTTELRSAPSKYSHGKYSHGKYGRNKYRHGKYSRGKYRIGGRAKKRAL